MTHIGKKFGLGSIGIQCFVTCQSQFTIFCFKTRYGLVKLLGCLLYPSIQMSTIGQQGVRHTVETLL